ncbi:MAG TPA: hypothetical protein VGK59_23310 [Ohtaekwangia sp.]
MPAEIVHKILNRIGHPDLVETLGKLSGTELNSLLLEVFSQQANSLTPPQLLNLYQKNRFVKPADLPVIDLRRWELDILELFQRHAFQILELSPVAALGSCSVVALADQKKVLSALRGTEVLADATNALALHISDLKKRKVWLPKSMHDTLRFGVIQRHVRTQQIEGKGFTPHFKIGCLVTSGADSGSFGFEKQALLEHITVMKALYKGYHQVEDLSFKFLCRKGYDDAHELARQVKRHVLQHHPELEIEIVDQPEKEIGYYAGIQYKVVIGVKGKTFEIGDGGFVDWTQKLLQNRKERMLSTGFGFEFMYRIVSGQLG